MEMKVLHVTGNRYDKSSLGDSNGNIWHRLSKGADSYHVFGRNSQFSWLSVSKSNVQLHLVPSVFGRMFEFFFSSWLVLWMFIKYRPTVVILQCPVYGGFAVSFASLFFKVNILVEFHGTHYFYPSSDNVMRHLEHFLYKILSRPAIKRARWVRSLSPGMSNFICKVYGVEVAKKITIVPTRVDLSIFNRKKNNFKVKEVLSIITVGALTETKDHLKLIRYMLDSGKPFKLTIVGSGPLENKIKSTINAWGVEDRVILAGRMGHETLSNTLLEHDVYIHMSKTEGLSRAILEAMAVGLPVISTRVGFIDGIFVDRKNCMLFDKDDFENFQSSLSCLAGSASLREQIGFEARQLIEDNFDAEKVFTKYLALIKN